MRCVGQRLRNGLLRSGPGGGLTIPRLLHPSQNIYIYVDEIYSLRLIKNNLVSDVTHSNTTNDKCMSRFNFFRRREYFPVL